MHHMREATNKNLTLNQWNSAAIQQLSTQQSVWPTNQHKFHSKSRFMTYSSSRRSSRCPCKPRVFNRQLIFGQTEAKLKVMAHGFCAEYAHFNHHEEFLPNSQPFGRKSWFFETNFSRNCGWSFSKFVGSCSALKNLYFQQDVVDLISIIIIL